MSQISKKKKKKERLGEIISTEKKLKNLYINMRMQQLDLNNLVEKNII